jgi:hypothetical protein
VLIGELLSDKCLTVQQLTEQAITSVKYMDRERDTTEWVSDNQFLVRVGANGFVSKYYLFDHIRVYAWAFLSCGHRSTPKVPQCLTCFHRSKTKSP